MGLVTLICVFCALTMQQLAYHDYDILSRFSEEHTSKNFFHNLAVFYVPAGLVCLCFGIVIFAFYHYKAFLELRDLQLTKIPVAVLSLIAYALWITYPNHEHPFLMYFGVFPVLFMVWGPFLLIFLDFGLTLEGIINKIKPKS